MGQVWRSFARFVSGAWYVVAAATGTLWDPVDLLKWLRIVPADFQMFPDDHTRVAVFLALTFVAMFAWFHQQRLRFDESHPDPTIPFHQVARFVGRQSVWAAEYPSSKDGQWLTNLDKEMVSKLTVGRLRAWGLKRENNEVDFGPTEIPADFWRRGQFDASDLVLGDVPPDRAYQFERHGGVTYLDVKFDKQQVRSCWRSRSLFDKIRRRSPAERTGALAIWQKQDLNLAARADSRPALSLHDQAIVDAVTRNLDARS